MKCKRFIAVILVFLVTFVVLSGCTQNTSQVNSPNTGQAGSNSTEIKTPDNFQAIVDKVTDSSDLPDWSGSKLNLKIWDAYGVGGGDKQPSTENITMTEASRVTGVSYDKENSFDNGGETFAEKIFKIIAVGDYPDILLNADGAEYYGLVKQGLLWDLTDLYPKYAPHLAKFFNNEILKQCFNSSKVTSNVSGKIYQAPISLEWGNDYLFERLYPDFPKDKLLDANVLGTSSYSYIFVRDDMLKKLYPNAMTKDEQEVFFAKNRTFTKDQIFDVPINSVEDFTKLMNGLKGLNQKEGNRDVYPIAVFSGGDNWPLLATDVMGVFGFPNWNVEYFTYWDKKTKKVEYTFKNDDFKKELYTYSSFIRNGLAPRECLIDTTPRYWEKANNGLYATTYSWLVPSDDALQKAGKKFKYRRVWMDVPYKRDTYKYFNGDPSAGISVLGIFKDSIKTEAEVAQILMSFDYGATKAGIKNAFWGPKSAGLFEEKNGVRKFKDKNLENEMVYFKEETSSGPNVLKYNLCGPNAFKDRELGTYPPLVAKTKMTDMDAVKEYARNGIREIRPEDFVFYFNPCTFDKREDPVPGFAPNLSNFNGRVEGVDKFWRGRAGVEQAITVIFASKDDAQFEKLYNEMLSAFKEAGLDDKTLAEINKDYETRYNKDFMKYIK